MTNNRALCEVMMYVPSASLYLRSGEVKRYHYIRCRVQIFKVAAPDGKSLKLFRVIPHIHLVKCLSFVFVKGGYDQEGEERKLLSITCMQTAQISYCWFSQIELNIIML